MKNIILVCFVCLLLCGCEDRVNVNTSNDLNDVKISKLMSENNYVIIDVRTKDEYDLGHLVDSINIPYDEIDDNIDISKDNIIFVYCKSGKRSGIAYNTLINLGYEVYNLGAYSDISLPKE